MKKVAKITVLGEDNQFAASFTGTIEILPNGYFIEYEDSENIKCVIGYTKGIATITKASDPVYTLVLEESCPHALSINTEYGTIEAVAHPHKISSRKRGNSIMLKLIYDLMFSVESFHHELRIRCDFED